MALPRSASSRAPSLYSRVEVFHFFRHQCQASPDPLSLVYKVSLRTRARPGSHLFQNMDGRARPLESAFARRPEAAAPWPHQPAAARRPTLYSSDDISCQSCHWCHSRANRLSPEYKVPLTTRVIRRAASCHILGHGAKALCTAFSRLDRDVRRSIAPSLSEVGVNFGLW